MKKAVIVRLICASLMIQPVLTALPASAKAEAGNVSVIEEQINGKTFSVAKATINATPAAVWQVLTDYGNAPRVFPQVKKAQVIEDHGNAKILKHKVASSGLPGTYEYVVEVKECPQKSLEWHRKSGSFKEVDGFWKLESMDAGHSTLVTYQAHVDGGFFAPQMIIRHQLAMDMPQVMSALKSQAENVPQIAGRPVSTREQ